MKKFLLSLLCLGLSAAYSLGQSSGGFQGRDNLGNHISTMDIRPNIDEDHSVGQPGLAYSNGFFNSLTVGESTNNADNSITVGDSDLDASGQSVIAAGNNSSINGRNIIAVGSGNSMTASNSSIFGAINTIEAEFSHAIGRNNIITNRGVVVISDFSGSLTSTVDDQFLSDFENGYLMCGGEVFIESDLLPKTANAVNLGSASLPFDDLFVNTNSIFMGTNIISVVGPGPGEILYNGVPFGLGADNLGDHTATQDLLPDTPDVYDIGAVANAFDKGYFEGLDVGSASGVVSDNSLQVGQGSTAATGDGSFAFGNNTIVSGANAAGLGQGHNVSSVNGFAIGSGSVVTNGGGNFAHNSTASGTNSVAMGQSSFSTGLRSFVFGQSSVASGEDSFVVGGQSAGLGKHSVAFGDLAKSNHDRTFVWSSSDVTVNSTDTNQFLVQADKGLVLDATDLLPRVDNTVSLGSASLQFSDLFVNTNSIHMGTNIISAAGPSPTDLLYNGLSISSAGNDNLGNHVMEQSIIPDTNDAYDLGADAFRLKIAYAACVVGGETVVSGATNSFVTGKDLSNITDVEHVVSVGRNVDMTNAIHVITVSDNTVVTDSVNSSVFGGLNTIAGADFVHILGRGVTITHDGVVAMNDSDGDALASGAPDQFIADFDNGYLLDGGNVRIEGLLLPDVSGGSDLGNLAQLFDDIYLSGTILMGTNIISVSGTQPTDVLYNGSSIASAGNDNLGNHVVEQDLIPDSNMAYDLGSSSFRFDIAYVDEMSVGAANVSGGMQNLGVGSASVTMTGTNSLAVGANHTISALRNFTSGTGNTNAGNQSVVMGNTHAVVSGANNSAIMGGTFGTVTHPGVVMLKDSTGTLASTAANQFISEFSAGYVMNGGDVNIASDLLPQTSNAVNLGSATLPFADLYVDTNSIFMGTNILSVTGDQTSDIKYNGEAVGGVVDLYVVNATNAFIEAAAGPTVVSNITVSSVPLGTYRAVFEANVNQNGNNDIWQYSVFDDGVVVAGSERNYEKSVDEPYGALLYWVFDTVGASSTIDIRIERISGAGSLDVSRRGFTLECVRVLN